LDTPTFIVQLVSALAWPVTLLVVLGGVIWKGPTLARFIKTIKYKDLEVQLDFEAARNEGEKLRSAENPPSLVPLDQADKTLQIAKIDPALAVVEAWKDLEGSIIRLMQHNGLIRFTTPTKFMFELAKQGKLSDSEIKLFQKLREIRNASVHSSTFFPSLSLAEAIEFRDLAALLGRKIDSLRGLPEYINIDLPPAKAEANSTN
jgi:hypothetical protein